MNCRVNFIPNKRVGNILDDETERLRRAAIDYEKQAKELRLRARKVASHARNLRAEVKRRKARALGWMNKHWDDYENEHVEPLLARKGRDGDEIRTTPPSGG